MFHQGLQYNTPFGYKSTISPYHDLIVPFFVGKHAHFSKLMSGTFNNQIPQPKFCLISDIEKVLSFPGYLDSEKVGLKMLNHRLTTPLAV